MNGDDLSEFWLSDATRGQEESKAASKLARGQY